PLLLRGRRDRAVEHGPDIVPILHEPIFELVGVGVLPEPKPFSRDLLSGTFLELVLGLDHQLIYSLGHKGRNVGRAAGMHDRNHELKGRSTTWLGAPIYLVELTQNNEEMVELVRVLPDDHPDHLETRLPDRQHGSEVDHVSGGHTGKRAGCAGKTQSGA